MKKTHVNSSEPKRNALAGESNASATINWIKPASKPAADSHPGWSRYIDSRLKQFCTR